MIDKPLLHDAFQIAYVTNDLDRAMSVMRDQLGCGEFLALRDMPDSPVDVALAFAGQTMIELIRPIARSGDIYSEHLDGFDGFAIRHHHFGMIVDSRAAIDAMREKHEALGHGIPLAGETPGFVQYLYADCRPTLGHFLEYIRLDDGGRKLFASVPGSSFA